MTGLLYVALQQDETASAAESQKEAMPCYVRFPRIVRYYACKPTNLAGRSIECCE